MMSDPASSAASDRCVTAPPAWPTRPDAIATRVGASSAMPTVAATKVVTTVAVPAVATRVATTVAATKVVTTVAVRVVGTRVVMTVVVRVVGIRVVMTVVVRVVGIRVVMTVVVRVVGTRVVMTVVVRVVGTRASRRDDRGHRGAPQVDDDRPLSFEEAEAQRAEADTWTHYSSTAGAAKEVTADNGFAALGVPAVLVERLARDGIADPFPIQEATIPDAIAGRDVLGRGRTGSGKTLAFGLSMITRLADGSRPQSKRPRSLILVPTRELAMQVSDALEPFVHVTGLRHKLVAGGLSYEPQIKALAKGLDILVATPGRLADLMERGAVDLSTVEIAVLDEADHMADMGFLPEVTAILDTIPQGGQRLLFSATLDKGIDTLVDRYLVDPVTHSTDDAQASVTTMSHHVLLIDPQDKKAMTAELAGRGGRVIVFARTSSVPTASPASCASGACLRHPCTVVCRRPCATACWAPSVTAR
jgi:hypothetical protein